MKKLISVIACCIFAASILAQDNSPMQSNGQITSTYCSLLKDGKMMLMAEGKQVNNEVTLADGTLVKTDGTVIKKDGSKVILKNGDCIDQDGNIIPSDKKRTEDKLIEEKKNK